MLANRAKVQRERFRHCSRTAPSNMALEATGHSGGFFPARASGHVARASAWALGFVWEKWEGALAEESPHASETSEGKEDGVMWHAAVCRSHTLFSSTWPWRARSPSLAVRTGRVLVLVGCCPTWLRGRAWRRGRRHRGTQEMRYRQRQARFLCACLLWLVGGCATVETPTLGQAPQAKSPYETCQALKKEAQKSWLFTALGLLALFGAERGEPSRQCR